MKLKKKRKIIISSFIFAILLSFSFFVVGYKYYLHPVLGSFQIEKILENDNLLYMNVTPSHNALSYKVIGYNEDNEIIYEQDSSSNIILLENLYANYNEKISFQVFSYDKNEKSLEAENKYDFSYSDLAFSHLLDHYTEPDKDFIVTFEGDSNKDSYTLDVYYEDLLLKSIPVQSNIAVIDKEVLNNVSGKVILKLNKNGKRITNQFTLYANTPVVGNISITNIADSYTMPWDDLTLFYDGGVNATSIFVYLYKNGKLANSLSFDYTSNQITIPASAFKENTDYTIELVAVYKDYFEIAKRSQVEISVLEKETVGPVYVDYNYKNIKKGTKIILASNTSGASIYYTLDGSEPSTNSILYTEPLVINEDVTIKTKAIRQNMFDSVTNTYDFHVGEKQLVIYLSPSNQYLNYGVKSAGYTTEMKMMNKLTDYLKPYLESFGVKVYRNNPNTDINAWTSESNYVKSDLHLAIHSNASEAHDAYGIEMYIDNASSKSLSIANKIYNNLYSIYPYKDKGSYRGVKYSDKSLGEANDSFIPCGTLIEVAYHDNYNDAKWIVDHLEDIAKNIGDSILEYYQVK